MKYKVTLVITAFYSFITYLNAEIYSHIQVHQEVYVRHLSGKPVRNARDVGTTVDFPDRMQFGFNINNKPVILDLKRSTRQPIHVPVFLATEDGMTEHRRTKDNDFAFYNQVNDSIGAALMVRCEKATKPCHTTGQFYVDEEEYIIEPKSSRDLLAGRTVHNIYKVVRDETSNYTGDAIPDNDPSDVEHVEYQSTRGRRNTAKDIKAVVELVCLLDYYMWLRWRNNYQTDREALDVLTEYYQRVVHEMDIRFESIQSFDISVVPAKIVVSKTSKFNSWFTGNLQVSNRRLPTLLDNPTIFDLKKALVRNPEKYGLAGYDALLVFTGADLAASSSAGLQYRAIGTALRGGSIGNEFPHVCAHYKRNIRHATSAIVEDRTTGATSQNAARELMHTLGVANDGDFGRSDCRDRLYYTMSSSLSVNVSPSITANRWRYSPCSEAALERAVNRILRDFPGGRSCLEETSVNVGAVSNGDKSFFTNPMTLREQCKFSFGDNYVNCDSVTSSICNNGFRCKKERTSNCNIRLAPLEGTYCGFRERCIQGKCVAYIPTTPDAKAADVDGAFVLSETTTEQSVTTTEGQISIPTEEPASTTTEEPETTTTEEPVTTTEEPSSTTTEEPTTTITEEPPTTTEEPSTTTTEDPATTTIEEPTTMATEEPPTTTEEQSTTTTEEPATTTTDELTATIEELTSTTTEEPSTTTTEEPTTMATEEPPTTTEEPSTTTTEEPATTTTDELTATIEELTSTTTEEPSTTTTEEPATTTTEEPVTTTEKPASTATEEPIITTTEAPPTTTEEPSTTTTEDPATTTTEEPTTMTTQKPKTTFEDPATTTTEEPATTTTDELPTTMEEPASTTTEEPATTTTEEPATTTTEEPATTTTDELKTTTSIEEPASTPTKDPATTTAEEPATTTTDELTTTIEEPASTTTEEPATTTTEEPATTTTEEPTTTTTEEAATTTTDELTTTTTIEEPASTTTEDPASTTTEEPATTTTEEPATTTTEEPATTTTEEPATTTTDELTTTIEEPGSTTTEDPATTTTEEPATTTTDELTTTEEPATTTTEKPATQTTEEPATTTTEESTTMTTEEPTTTTEEPAKTTTEEPATTTTEEPTTTTEEPITTTTEEPAAVTFPERVTRTEEPSTRVRIPVTFSPFGFGSDSSSSEED